MEHKLIFTTLESGDFHTALPLLENMTSDQLSQLTLPDKCTPLHYACRHGRVDVAQQLITHCKYSIESKDGKGCTPLHTAAQYGQVSILKYLLFIKEEFNLKLPFDMVLTHRLTSIFQCKLSEDHRDLSGNTPMHTACVHGQLDIFQLLTREIGCDPNDTNSDGLSCLHLAAQHGHLPLVRYLIEEVGSDVTLGDEHGRSPTYLAAGVGHLDILKYLIGEVKANPHFSTNREWIIKFITASGRSLVHTASREGHFHVVRYLVEQHDCDPSHKDDRGVTPLHLACQQGHMKIIAYLITEGNCDPNCTDNDGNTCLHAASWGSGDLSEVIRYLVINHRCSLLVKNKFGNLPLHSAALNGNLDVVKCAIEDIKCSPNCKGEFGRIPLHHAIEGGHIEVVKYLVNKHHCNPLCPDENSITPLYMAAANGQLDIFKFFTITKGCNPLCKQANNVTPLHLAARNNNLNFIKFIIEEMKCDPNVQGPLKWRPLHISLKHHYFDISMYLIGLSHCDVLATVSDGLKVMTPLSLAVETQNLDIIMYLCSTRRLDPYLQPNKEELLQATSNTEILEYLKQFPDPLHTAAVYGDVETVRHYVEREKWCPKKFDRYGNNTLHNAAQHGQLEVVKYLTGLSKDPINEEVEILCDPQLKNKYGLTAQAIASQNGHRHVVSYLLRATTNQTVLQLDVISPPLSIFVVGNSGSGKSTLVKALSSESSLLGQITKVKGVLPLTAGIVPTTLDSQVFGKVKIYDFAGHEEYYASHEMILGQTSHPLVLLTVDISLPNLDSEVLKQVSYWLSIISSSVTADAQFRNIHVVIIGSHADQVKFKSRKQIHQDVISLVSSGYSLKYHGFIQCDCRYSTSDSMKHLRQKLNTICKSVRLFLAHENDLSNKRCASLMYHIEHNMSKEVTMTVNKLHKRITSSLTPGSPLVQFVDSELLLETCKTLSSNGHLLLLPHDDDIQESLLVLDNEFILSKVHACLAIIKERLTNEIGILEESQLGEVLSELFVESVESDLAIKYLVFAQFCTKVSSDQLISVPANIRGTSHYFFPNLAQASRPADLFPEESSLYTWCLKCSNPHHFFTPRYLHTLFIQLVKCQSDTDNIKFSIWKNGILLVHCGTRSIIEVTDQCTQFYLVMQCMKGCESHLVKQRSCLIALIKTLLVKGCPNLNLDEFLLAPHQVYPPSNAALIGIADVAHSIVTGHPTVPFELSRGSSPQQVLLDKLLSFDSFHVIEKSLLQSIIFTCSHSSNIVPLATMERVHCAVNSCRDLAERLEDEVRQCRRDMTCSQLYKELIKYSIFTDGNLYVSHIFYRRCIYELVTLLF